MIDAYKAINKGFNPSGPDIHSYFTLMDVDQD